MAPAPTGHTQVAAVIGDPVRHSLSPALYNAAFAASGLDWVFVAFEIPAGSGAAAVQAMQVLGLRGLSVTMPHKTDVAAACDGLSADAALLKSVNHVRLLDDGSTFGDSTDGEGLLRSLREAGVEPAGRSVLLLGAGGAARAAAVALARAGATVHCAARRPEAGHEVARLAEGSAVGFDEVAEALVGCDLLVNATPVGMGDDPASPVDARWLRANVVVADLVYHPFDTPLLRAARDAGAVAVDGLGMLIHQAAIQFEHWTGVAAPLDAMRAAALTALT
jgi:shikimate dehydrogenase